MLTRRTPFALAGPLLLLVVACACRPPQNAYVPPPPPEVTVANPVQKKVQSYFEFTATTAGIETVEIRARVKGFIEKVHFDAGAVVEAGQLLFTIDQRPFQARVEQAEAELAGRRASLSLAQVNLERTQRLFEKGQAADIELKEWQSKTDEAKAAVDLAIANLVAARLDLEYTEVRSPINGHIGRNLVDVGALVGADGPTLLASVVNDATIYAYFDASEADLLQWVTDHPNVETRAADSRRLPVWLATAADREFVHTGTFDSADNRVDPQTGTIRLRAVFPNDDRTLMSGLFVRVRMPKDRRTAMLLPDTAVSADQAGRFVLVVNDQNVVERRGVTVGDVYDRMRQIDSGLTGQEWVIVNGQQRTRLGAPVIPQRASAEPSTDARPPSSRPTPTTAATPG